MLRVAVIGAGGRMGASVCEAVREDPDTDLVARVGPADSLETIIDAGADVAVEFTTPTSVKYNVAWLLARGVHTVVGATGLTDEDLVELEGATGPANLFVAPNFAIGAVLLMRFAAEAARHLPSVEIIEAHHDRKVDAPSGTALRTASLIAHARQSPQIPGPTGHPARGDLVNDVRIHSLRLPGVVAIQDVIFGGPGQTLTLRHEAIDRSSFMPGVLMAIKAIPFHPGVTNGLEHLL